MRERHASQSLLRRQFLPSHSEDISMIFTKIYKRVAQARDANDDCDDGRSCSGIVACANDIQTVYPFTRIHIYIYIYIYI
jgi:hypothetical protein